jgi:hypothetical protein
VLQCRKNSGGLSPHFDTEDQRSLLATRKVVAIFNHASADDSILEEFEDGLNKQKRVSMRQHLFNRGIRGFTHV